MAAENGDSQGVALLPEVVVPSTPPPQPLQTSNSAEMTPPPSTQPPKPSALSANGSSSPPRALLPQSPPSTVKMSAGSMLPSSEDIARAEPNEVRRLAQDLLVAVAEARMSAAHFKLQHNLLELESEEAAQRAEIEHQMTRREVEVLQANENQRSSFCTTPQRSRGSIQQQVDTLKMACQDLEDDKSHLNHRLQKAKRIIEKEMDKAELLYEENLMLKRRIRENREHFTILRQSPAFSTPRDDFTTPMRKAAQRYPESAPPRRGGDRSQDPLAALLAADQVLSGEAASVPSTPSRTHPANPRQGHTRGAFSLSALQTTPLYSRSFTAVRPAISRKEEPRDRLPYSAPSTQLPDPKREQIHHDRDSTISVSEEEAVTEDDLPQSQASSLATTLLRRNSKTPKKSSLPDTVEKSSKVLQTKLFGVVKKSGIDRKRQASFGDHESGKRTRAGEGIGLGIKA